MQILLVVDPENDSLSELDSVLTQSDDVSLVRAGSAREALDLVSEEKMDFVIADEGLGDKAGLELIADIVSINPMITCAVVSGLAPGAFHEASEGLGIMTQLPTHPDKEHAESFLQQLRQIKNLTKGG